MFRAIRPIRLIFHLESLFSVFQTYIRTVVRFMFYTVSQFFRNLSFALIMLFDYSTILFIIGFEFIVYCYNVASNLRRADPKDS